MAERKQNWVYHTSSQMNEEMNNDQKRWSSETETSKNVSCSEKKILFLVMCCLFNWKINSYAHSPLASSWNSPPALTIP